MSPRHPASPALFRLDPEDRRDAVLPLVGRRVDVVHSPRRGAPAEDLVYRGTLVSACRAPWSPSHLLVLRVDTLDRGTYDLAVPLSQVREVRPATLRGTLELTPVPPPTDETQED
jgi:hypothetical protein